MKPAGRERVFVDTAALIAPTNADDALHRRAVEAQAALKAARTRLVTTDWVLTEFLGFMSGRRSRMAGAGAVATLRASPRATVMPARRRDWTDGFALYRDRPDKGWSLVDCISIVICERLGIGRVFTHDAHFLQAGLEVLLR